LIIVKSFKASTDKGSSYFAGTKTELTKDKNRTLRRQIPNIIRDKKLTYKFIKDRNRPFEF
jgi:hypothetical protein